jgi:hypothetical protein
LFNLVFVSAAVLTAVVLPETGKSIPAVCFIAAAYAITGLIYLRTSRTADSGIQPSA